MHINTPIIGQEFAQQEGGFVKPLEVAVEAPPPGVAVGFLFDDAGLFYKPGGFIGFRIGVVGTVAVKEKLAPVSKGGSM